MLIHVCRQVLPQSRGTRPQGPGGRWEGRGRLDGYTWHCNRHTFASHLVMAGVDLTSVQTLGGWRTLAMVQWYSHLAPAALLDAVERLVPANAVVELSRNYPKVDASQAGVS